MKPSQLPATLRNAFVTGLLLIIPAAVTLTVFVYLFHLSTLFLPPLIKIVWKEEISTAGMLALKSLGLLGLIALITCLGLLAQHVFFKKILGWGELLLLQLPLIPPIYKGVKQIAEIFQGGKVALFQKVVLVEYPKEDSYVPAFLTSEASPPIKHSAGGKDLVGVYVPTTPNPTSGFLLYVPRDKVFPVDMTSTEAMTLIMSGGVAKPQNKPPKNPQKE
jgi:uncharacterized membrane protein